VYGPDYERRSGRNEDDPSHRSPSHRDRDRILYSESFRRLGGVTQVALGRPELVLHNRLTHSLKVEQVGLSIVSKLSHGGGAEGFDHSAIAAACLAHDLGHPPFGHAAEAELNALLTCESHRNSARPYAQRVASPCTKCKLEDGFEGNAQSFRILTRLATHRGADSPGLDLTYRSLRAVTKYPWLRGENALKPRKWGAYDCDAEVLFTVTGQDPGRSYAEQPVQQSLDAQVMDWADDISYAVHDIEDFYRSGHIPLADYKPKSETLKRFLEYASKPEALGELEPEIISAFENLLTFMPKTAYAGTDEDHAVLDMVRSTMLTQFIDSTTLEQGVLRRDEVQDKLNALVKQLIWFHVIDGPRLASIQIGQQRIVRELFEVLAPVALTAYRVDDGDHPDDQLVRRLPYNLRVYIDRTRANSGPTYKLRECVYRGLADFISSLSDEDAYYQHSVLVGRPSHRHL